MTDSAHPTAVPAMKFPYCSSRNGKGKSFQAVPAPQAICVQSTRHLSMIRWPWRWHDSDYKRTSKQYRYLLRFCLELIFDLISKTLVNVIFVWRHWTAFIVLMNVHPRLWPLGTKIRIIRYCDVPVGKEHKKPVCVSNASRDSE